MIMDKLFGIMFEEIFLALGSGGWCKVNYLLFTLMPTKLKIQLSYIGGL